MIEKLLGSSIPRRFALAEFLSKILLPLNKSLLKIDRLRKIEFCFLTQGFYFYFRPFVLTDLVLLFSDWEPYVKKIFLPQIGQIVFDIGAHIGFYTLLAAKKVGNSGLVVAFEPDQESFNLLKKNIQINGFTNVKSFDTAIGKKMAKVSFT